jgi:nucleoside-diphosphate-sugar epimerase
MLRTRGRLLVSDLEEVVSTSAESLKKLANSRILITGATGFIGTWISSTLMEANERYSLNLELTIITRSQFLATEKLNLGLLDKVQFIEHDVRNTFPRELGSFDFYIHGATPSNAITGSNNSELVVDSSVKGLKNLLELIRRGNTVPTVMHLSSGAVYGDASLKLRSIPENESVVHSPSNLNPYMFAKIETEKLILEATEKNYIKGTNPRLFAFAGPHIPLDQHFAVGNFLRDRLANMEIEIIGNLGTVRSYMYPTDMCNWLLALLVNPTLETIHVGSPSPITMDQLARTISECTEGIGVRHETIDSKPSHYVPEIFKTLKFLKVVQKVKLEDAIVRWWEWINESSR